jgi:hypothetical protein
MEDAKRIAVAGYRKVLEDGPDVCDSESDSEHSEHGEMWSYSDMSTPDMLDANGKPRTGVPIQLTAEQANSTRAAANANTGCYTKSSSPDVEILASATAFPIACRRESRGDPTGQGFQSVHSTPLDPDWKCTSVHSQCTLRYATRSHERQEEWRILCPFEEGSRKEGG